MSNNNSEQVIVSAKANVMIYDDVNRKWNPSGTTPGIAKVQIYQHLLNQTYRVVGRKLQDHEVVINCLLAKGLKYNQANQTFLQWRDSKQVYGLHFHSKEEADAFTQTLKMAVDNLNRLAAMQAPNALGNAMTGDNISVGKRSISSDYNPIYDENDRQCYNVVHSNGNGISHHTSSSNGIYNGGNGPNAAAISMQQQRQLQQQQQSVTSPPLSASSSTSSSSSTTSNGLSIAITNNTSSNNLNGGTNGYHHRQNSDYNYSSNGNGTNQVYIKQESTQQPLYQSSPIPPPPPPPPVPIFANLNGSNPANNNSSNYIASIHSNSSMNNSNNDNYSQKIYDVIPDSNFTGQSAQSSAPPPPPPPPIPTGLFNGSGAGGAPPPPPPINQLLNAVSSNASSSSSSSNTTGQTSASQQQQQSYTNEIAKFQQNKLKKVEESASSRPAPQLDFLTEIRQKIEKKQQQQTTNGINGVNSEDTVDSAGYKPSSLAQRGGGKANTTQQYRQQPPQQFDSPKTIKKIISTPNVVNGNGTNGNGYTNGPTSNGVDGALNLDKLKQELVNEFRKELQTFKADIISTILSELRKQNN